MNISKLLTALPLHTGDEAILEDFILPNSNKGSSITKPKYIFIHFYHKCCYVAGLITVKY